MNINPFTSGLKWENDPEGFIIPQQLATRTEREILKAKYDRLRKASHGLIVRLGIAEKGDRR